MNEGAGERAGVDDVGTGLRYGVVEFGIPKRSTPQGCQDGAVELPLGDVVDRFEIVRQRDSPPPITSARAMAVYSVGHVFGYPVVA